MAYMPMPWNIVLRFTEEIIDTAVPGDSQNCLIAVALRDWAQRNDLEIWSISANKEHFKFNCWIDGKAYRFTYVIPGQLSVTVDVFDRRVCHVDPFKLNIHSRTGSVAFVEKRRKPTDPIKTYKPRETNVEQTMSSRGDAKKTRKKVPRRCRRRFAGTVVKEGALPGHLRWRNAQTKGARA